MFVSALSEEWQLFKMWCPWKITDMIDDVYVEYEDYIKIIRMMNILGFKALAEDFLQSRFLYRRNETIDIVCADKVEEKYDGQAFVKAFIDNIKSENIRRMFAKI